jgi:hypothetical protein
MYHFFNIKNSAFCQHSALMWWVLFSEQAWFINLNI